MKLHHSKRSIFCDAVSVKNKIFENIPNHKPRKSDLKEQRKVEMNKNKQSEIICYEKYKMNLISIPLLKIIIRPPNPSNLT